MGKTVIVVGDGPGFYTTRVLAFMVQEAGLLLESGVAIEEIDRALTRFGFPVGPMALTDEVGIDVAAHISAIMHDAFPDRFAPSTAIQKLVDAGRLGRKSGAGFYNYSGKRKKPDPTVYAFRQSAPQHLPRDLMARRMVLAFVNEAARCLEEGVIASPRDGDVGAIMGLGFPPFLGGPFRYADSLGMASLVEQLGQMQYAYGERFRPAEILRRMAHQNERFYADGE
jgi:3-hydroxyacyl-CoA dehydrogenase/enoyl-CoA hydratase/3-hydroxybutyryl-CoA epimerase